MCGIIAYASSINKIDPENFVEMRDTMIHRGPDGKGEKFFQDQHIALGHRRLSIIDLSEQGAQPMSDGLDEISITFNGEIYNYRELRKELDQKYTFVSTSDTEVLLYGYREWGIDTLLSKINGMFAFCIWDETKKKMYVARDRVGIKPLYYYKNSNEFVFASELKAITKLKSFTKELSQEGLSSYFTFRYIIAPYTIYKNCFKLKPGHYLEYDFKRNDIEIVRYWDFDFSNPEESYNINELRALLNKAVKYRVETSDVPVHTFLSGGIDSSLITGISKRFNDNLEAYSIEVDDDFKNEIKDAQHVADFLKVELKQEKLTPQLFNSMHNEVIGKYDEPLADTSCIPTFFLCKLAAKNVKVALSGDGGDELFYGYSWYADYINAAKTDASLERYLSLALNTLNQSEVKNILPFDVSEKIKTNFIANLGAEKLSPINAHVLDYYTFMVDDILTKVDIASMANSLEVRVPFLDHNVVEAAFSISYKAHYQEDELKYLLKKISEEILPKETIYKKKKGFSVPSVNWIECDFEYNIVEGYASQDEVWNKKAIKELIQSKLHEEQKWLLYNFERWYAINFHGKTTPKQPNLLFKLKRRLLK